MNEMLGVLAAVASSALGGTSIGATRYVVGACDPLLVGVFRFGIGFVLLLPLALLRGEPWPPLKDWPAVVGLGVLFFGLFPVLFNASLLYTTAARGALALSMLPLLTMAVGALLGIEPLTGSKTLGVVLATAGVAIALLSDLRAAPQDAWRGDLLMIAAALCMALYNVWSKPFIRRSGAISFTALGMAPGALLLILLSLARGSFGAIGGFHVQQWLALAYLGVFGAAITFFLWAFALGHTTPTKVAISVTVNPVTATIFGAMLLGEPIRWNLVVGLLAVATGIFIATTTRRSVAVAAE